LGPLWRLYEESRERNEQTNGYRIGRQLPDQGEWQKQCRRSAGGCPVYLQGDIDRPVPLKNLQVEGLLNHIKGLVQGDALQKGLDIWVQVGGYGQISWPLNQDLFTHIMLNLASNAIRFTPDGGRVTVSADIEGEELVVRVQDTGIGISQEELPHIYDRFYRVAQDRNRDTGGTGLGLAITRQAVLRHGGTIDVESTPGDGTTFEVRFPYINSSYIET
jgi:signal transduction histidine kinase